jgi:hypothetical protein
LTFWKDKETEAKKTQVLYGMSLGASVAKDDAEEDEDEGDVGFARVVDRGKRVSANNDNVLSCYTDGTG